MNEPADEAREVEGGADQPKYVSDKGGERAEKWMQRIEASNEPWEDGEAERAMYRDAEWGVFPAVVAGVSDIPVELLTVTGSAAGPEQVVLNVVNRVIRRAKAKGFDKAPLVKFPRRSRGIEVLAEGLEQVLTRIYEKAHLVQAFRDGVSRIYTDGGFGVFVGMPWIPTRDEVADAAKGGEELVEDAVQGQHKPSRYQDHRAAVGALLNITADPEIGANAPPEDLKNMERAAQAHAEAEDAEAAGTTRFEKATLEMEPLALGAQLRRDMSSPYKRHWRWMARLITMTRREAHGLVSVRGEWVDRLPVYKTLRDEQGRRYRVEAKDVEEDVDATVAFWEVYDSWHMARHLVAEGVEGYGEVDERYPYMKRDGSGPSIRGFFPFVICTPNTTAEGEPIPGCRTFWHQQIELIKIDSAILSVVKRAALDIYGASSEQYQQIEKALKDGVGGRVLPFPPNTNVGQAFQALNLKGPIQELSAEREKKLIDISIAANFPLSELTSQPQADTVGQEKIAANAGVAGVADEVAQAAVAFGECLDIAWDLVREHWAVEDVNAEMGQDAASVWDQWVASPLSDEVVSVEFGASSLDHNQERAQSIMALFDKAVVMVDPATGMPAFDGPKMLNMTAKALGLGELPPFQPPPEMAAAMQAGMAPGGAPPGGQPPGGGGEPMPPDDGPGQPSRRGRRRGMGGRGGPGEPTRPAGDPGHQVPVQTGPG